MKAARYLVLFMGAAALVAYAQEGEGLTPRLQGAAKSQHQIDMEEGFRLNPTLTIGGAAPDFNLEGVGGKKHTLADRKSANVLAVMFICNHCPASQLYEARSLPGASENDLQGKVSRETFC